MVCGAAVAFDFSHNFTDSSKKCSICLFLLRVSLSAIRCNWLISTIGSAIEKFFLSGERSWFFALIKTKYP